MQLFGNLEFDVDRIDLLIVDASELQTTPECDARNGFIALGSEADVQNEAIEETPCEEGEHRESQATA